MRISEPIPVGFSQADTRSAEVTDCDLCPRLSVVVGRLCLFCETEIHPPATEDRGIPVRPGPESMTKRPASGNSNEGCLFWSANCAPWVECYGSRKGAGPLLPHIDRIARSAKVRIETFSAAPMGRGSGSLRYWKCDLKASFRPLLVFLRKMGSSERIVHIRSLTIRPVSARNKSPRLLQLSLHLAAPTTGDNIR